MISKINIPYASLLLSLLIASLSVRAAPVSQVEAVAPLLCPCTCPAPAGLLPGAGSLAGLCPPCPACPSESAGSPSVDSSPVVNAPVGTTSCGNRGLAYAIQTHTFTDDDETYSKADIDFFHTASPVQTGFTTKIGFVHADVDTPYSVYGGETRRIDYIAVNHRAYFVPPVTGTYTISTTKFDDFTLVWIGPNAYNGNYNRKNANFSVYIGQPAVSYTIELKAGEYTPFRVLMINGQGAAAFDFTIASPDGKVLIDSTGNAEPDVFVQFSCDRIISPPFQDFGKETA